MMKFLHRTFIKPYADVFRIVGMVPALVLMLGIELLKLAKGDSKGDSGG